MNIVRLRAGLPGAPSTVLPPGIVVQPCNTMVEPSMTAMSIFIMPPDYVTCAGARFGLIQFAQVCPSLPKFASLIHLVIPAIKPSQKN
jgi:hypothetical protein